MALLQTATFSERLTRRTLFAVELFDPVAGVLRQEGFTVTAAGLDRLPIVNESRRFVWLEEGDRWPGRISVDPGRAPFAREVALPLPRPASLLTAPAAARLLRIVLRPAPAYRFDDGVTSVSGTLRQNNLAGAPPLSGARVQLAWRDANTGIWTPAPPAPVFDLDPSPPSPPQPETDRRGEFAVFLRLRPLLPAEPDLVAGRVAVRLQLTLGSRDNPITRATADTFPFLPDTPGRLVEGRRLERALTLAWDELVDL
jgi:hypothetical protein